MEGDVIAAIIKQHDHFDGCIYCEHDQLLTKNAELLKYKERLDWSIEQGYLDDLVDGFSGTLDTIIVEIDANITAMKGQ